VIPQRFKIPVPNENGSEDIGIGIGSRTETLLMPCGVNRLLLKQVKAEFKYISLSDWDDL
jgi:hypothetical protein